jgi:hypothetical protein
MKGAGSARGSALSINRRICRRLARRIVVRKSAPGQPQNMVDDNVGCAILTVEETGHW